MNSIKYIGVVTNHLFVMAFVSVFRLLLKIGIFKEPCKSFIASYDLGYSSSEYKRKNYGNAASVLRKYISMENDYCHGALKYNIALLYFYGHGIEKDLLKAEKFFLQAAGLGSASAKEYISKKSETEKNITSCSSGTTPQNSPFP